MIFESKRPDTSIFRGCGLKLTRFKKFKISVNVENDPWTQNFSAQF